MKMKFCVFFSVKLFFWNLTFIFILLWKWPKSEISCFFSAETVYLYAMRAFGPPFGVPQILGPPLQVATWSQKVALGFFTSAAWGQGLNFAPPGELLGVPWNPLGLQLGPLGVPWDPLGLPRDSQWEASLDPATRQEWGNRSWHECQKCREICSIFELISFRMVTGSLDTPGYPNIDMAKFWAQWV